MAAAGGEERTMDTRGRHETNHEAWAEQEASALQQALHAHHVAMGQQVSPSHISFPLADLLFLPLSPLLATALIPLAQQSLSPTTPLRSARRSCVMKTRSQN